MANRLKTTLLLGALTGLLLYVGYILGGQGGALTALVLSAAMNFGSYWFSDRIVLAMYGAKEVPEQSAPELYVTVRRLTQRLRMPMPRLYLVDLPVPNAFATGRNEQHAAVAVTSGILRLLTTDELEGVLAHELSHVKNRDVLVSSVAATIAGALSYLAQLAYYASAFGGRERRDSSPLGGLVLVVLAPLVATLLHLAVSRSREYLADETGARTSGKAPALAAALQKIHAVSRQLPLASTPAHEATAHLFFVNPFRPSLLTSLFSTHPPVEERVRRLLAAR